jgi:hypothetical protein
MIFYHRTPRSPLAPNAPSTILTIKPGVPALPRGIYFGGKLAGKTGLPELVRPRTVPA